MYVRAHALTHVCTCYSAIALEMASEAESPERAVCPLCGRQVAFGDINSHIDSCLSRQQQQRPRASSAGEKNDTRDASTTPSASSAGRGLPRGRQSLLSCFGRRAGTSSSGEEPPPGKKRKLSMSVPKPQICSTPCAAPAASCCGEVGVLRPVPSSTLPAPLPSPLADLVRPSSIADYVGQEDVMGHSSLLRSALESGHVPSLVFWGPPGCGKTTLVRILARAAREKTGAKFVQLSATCSGVGEVKQVMKVARNDKVMFKRQTVLFIDEIHQFNKLQQDTFLPHVEDGTIILIGATTENPSFRLNSALLSRCRVIVLSKLQPEDVQRILRRAMGRLGAVEGAVEGAEDEQREKRGAEKATSKAESEGKEDNPPVVVEREAIALLSEFCDGDARSALNALQTAVESAQTRQLRLAEHEDVPELADSCEPAGEREARDVRAPSDAGQKSPETQQGRVTAADAKESLQRTHLLYDRAGEEHYNCISALHKSMRGSHASASLYWLARMLCAGEDPLYVARRIVRFASEDVGLADPLALPQAVAAYQSCQLMGMPECEVALAQAVIYMARAPKSIEVYRAYGRAVSCVRDHRGPQPSVPLHLRNAPTRLTRELGYGAGYQYNPDCSGPVEQEYMPEGLQHVQFLQ